jgi:hypothetical protein
MSSVWKVNGMAPVLDVWYTMLDAIDSDDLGHKGASGAAAASVETSGFGEEGSGMVQERKK